MGMAAEATDMPVAIPLDLAPLLLPYRRYRRISLRIERLPDRARLSKGRNNGDRSWSLTRDDLEDLYYLLPRSKNSAHMLAVRIINLDSDDGATLAVLDIPIAPEIIAFPSNRGAPDFNPVQDAEIRRLRDALSEAEEAVDVRDRKLADALEQIEQLQTGGQTETQAERVKRAIAAELANARNAWEAELVEYARERVEQAREHERQEADAALSRAEESWKADEAVRLAAAETRWQEQSARVVAKAVQKAEQAEKARQSFAAELAAAQTAWEVRLEQRLADAAAEAATQLQSNRALWKAEQNGRLAKAEERAQERLEKAQAGWRQEAAAALAKAEENWRAEEAARLAAAEARWREQSVQELQDARQKTEQAMVPKQAAEAELAAARTAWEAELADRLAKASAAADAMLSQAKESWKAAEADRLAAAATQWREQAARELSDAHQQAQQTQDTGETAEAALAAARAAWEAELAERLARAAAESDAVLSREKDSWKTAEDERFAAAETQWRQQTAHELAEAQQKILQETDTGRTVEAALAAARKAWDAELAERLTQAAAEATATLETSRADWQAQQDHRLADVEEHVRQRVDQAHESWLQEADAVLANARHIWEAGEAKRLAEAQAQWQEQSARTLSDVTVRLERTEAALRRAHAETGSESGGPESDGNEAASDHAADPAQVRAAIRQARQHWKAEAETALQRAREEWRAEEIMRLDAAKRDWHREARSVPLGNTIPEAIESQLPAPPAGNFLRDCALAVCVTVALVILYPSVESMLWPAAPPPASAHAHGAPAAANAQTLPQSPLQAGLVTIHAAKVHAGPSGAAAEVALVARGAQVVLLERHGNWVRVRIPGEHGAHAKEGWVFGAFLKDSRVH